VVQVGSGVTREPERDEARTVTLRQMNAGAMRAMTSHSLEIRAEFSDGGNRFGVIRIEEICAAPPVSGISSVALDNRGDGDV
jgi:hypothetical protein